MERRDEATRIQRQQVGHADLLNPRQRREVLAQSVVDRPLSTRVGIFRRGKVETKREDVVWLVAGVHVRQRREAPQHQAGSNEQDQSEPYLSDRERVPEAVRSPVATRRRPGPEPFEAVHEIDFGCSKSRDHTHEHRCQEGDAEIESENRPVQLDVVEQGDIARTKHPQHANTPRSNESTDRAAGKAVDDTLEKLSDDEPAPSRAKRRPHRQVALAASRANEKQIRDVGARDQKHESHRAREYQELRPHRAHELLVHRRQVDGDTLVHPARHLARLAQVVQVGLCCGLGALDAHPGLQLRDHG